MYAIFRTLCVVTTSNTIPPVYPAVMGTQHLLGCKFTGQASCISYGYRWDFVCSHPQAERCGQYSCELLAQLQEFACTGLISLLSAQASWLCQVCVTAQRQQENLHFCICILHLCVCVAVAISDTEQFVLQFIQILESIIIPSKARFPLRMPTKLQWLRLGSKMSLLIVKLTLALSFSPHTFSWLSYLSAKRQWLHDSK